MIHVKLALGALSNIRHLLQIDQSWSVDVGNAPVLIVYNVVLNIRSESSMARGRARLLPVC